MKVGMVPTKELPGVYAIIHIKSGTTYIGGTTGPIRIRWNAHKHDLNANDAHNPYLQAAWNVYGAEAFKCVALENTESPDSVFQHEQTWIDMARLDDLKLYNLNYRATIPYMLGRTHDEEARKKISKANLGRKHTAEARENMARAHVGNKSRAGQRRSIEERQKTSIAMKQAWADGRMDNRRPVLTKIRRENAEKAYPAFAHRETGRTISPGIGLKKLCKKLGINYDNMCSVKTGNRKSCGGWEVLQCA